MELGDEEFAVPDDFVVVTELDEVQQKGHGRGNIGHDLEQDVVLFLVTGLVFHFPEEDDLEIRWKPNKVVCVSQFR